MTRLLLLLLGCTIISSASAQFGKDILKRAEQSASSKVSQKVDDKIDEGLDNVFKGKKKKQKKEKPEIIFYIKQRAFIEKTSQSFLPESFLWKWQ